MRVLSILLSTVVFSSVASAADVPVRRLPTKAPVAPVVVAGYDWTGWYFGGHAGVAWSRGAVSDAPLPNAVVANQPFLSFDNDASSVIGGIQGGYNWQFNRNWVVGVEADFSFSSLNGSQTYAPVPVVAGAVVAGSSETLSRDVEWFGTVRGRLGYAFDRWLVFATGGFAFAKIKNDALSIFPGGSVYSFSDHSTKTGWTVGGGLEYGLTGNWTVRGEYLYLEFEDTAGVSFGVPSTAPVGSSYAWKTRFTSAALR